LHWRPCWRVVITRVGGIIKEKEIVAGAVESIVAAIIAVIIAVIKAVIGAMATGIGNSAQKFVDAGPDRTGPSFVVDLFAFAYDVRARGMMLGQQIGLIYSSLLG
jgi:hypothetical protein